MDYRKIIEDNIIYSKQSYSEVWNDTTKLYSEMGYYSNFASYIPKDSNVLEVGTGTGYSTLSILDRTRNYLGIDMNSFCLRKVEEKLRKNNIKYNIQYRSSLLVNSDFRYKFNWNSIIANENEIPKLIEGDINSDYPLEELLKTMQFDVVLCWMLGYFKLYNESSNFQSAAENSERSPNETRRVKYGIQRKIAEISKTVLNNEGFIYVIERFDERIKEEEAQNYLINLTEECFVDFKVTSFDYVEGANLSDLEMINAKGEIINPDTLYFGIMKLHSKKNHH